MTVSRRRFVQGIGAAALTLGRWPVAAATAVPTLRGDTFDLVIGETTVNVTGRVRPATTVNGSLPAPTLVWREGNTVTIRVTNRMRVPSSIHWHGLILPADMDGVPGMSFDGIAPGATFVYRFPVKQTGTYWYHGHSRFQEQTGLYGAIVIEPRDAKAAMREHVLLLSDWSDEDPEAILSNLKKLSEYYNFNEPTAVDFARDASRMGVAQALAKRKMWNAMRMSPTDLADVTGRTYTYLCNGASPDANWTAAFSPGEKVRLRVINGSSMSFFDVRIPGLAMTVVAADGQDVEPVTVDEFRVAAAETYDVIVTPEDRAYTVFAQSIDRTGYARATLAPRAGMTAEVPAMDAPRWLDAKDMMGAMAMGGDLAGTHAHGGMPMDHGAMDHGAMHHGPSRAPVRHARSEYGPGVDMRVDIPRDNLDDPGVGLRDNGRRVLTYADLSTVDGPLDDRDPGRDIELHLTGNMARYMWSFDGQKFSEARPLRFREGERLRIVLVNDTMMPHPIHLHGMWSEVEDPDGDFLVRKHTVMVQPAQRIAYRVTADAPGRWAYHCHLLFHMEAGMFREVVVS